MSSWKPVVDRGDGGWIGMTSIGQIGMGTKSEERATLEQTKFVPMWAFMETEFISCRDEFMQKWSLLKTVEYPTVDLLLAMTIDTGLRSNSKYWSDLARKWFVEAKAIPDFPFLRFDEIEAIIDGPATSTDLGSE